MVFASPILVFHVPLSILEWMFTTSSRCPLFCRYHFFLLIRFIYSLVIILFLDIVFLVPYFHSIIYSLASVHPYAINALPSVLPVTVSPKVAGPKCYQIRDLRRVLYRRSPGYCLWRRRGHVTNPSVSTTRSKRCVTCTRWWILRTLKEWGAREKKYIFLPPCPVVFWLHE